MARHFVRKAVSVGKYLTGGFTREMRAASEHSPMTLVLCYHRVTTQQPAGATALEAGTPAAVFERQLRFLLSIAQPVRAAEAAASDAPLTFAVTFDDGTRDNIEVAAPILERLGVPATFYVVTDYVGTDRLYWWEELAVMMRAPGVRKANLAAALSEAGMHEPVKATQAEDRNGYDALAETIRLSPPAMVETALDVIASQLGTARQREGRHYPLMTWDDLNELAGRGFDIGNHTRTHPNLEGLDADELEGEIAGAAKDIEQKLGRRAGSFAFPYGIVRKRDDKAERILERLAGPAFSTGPGIAHAASPRTSVPRLQLNQGRPMVWAHNILEARRATFGAA